MCLIQLQINDNKTSKCRFDNPNRTNLSAHLMKHQFKIANGFAILDHQNIVKVSKDHTGLFCGSSEFTSFTAQPSRLKVRFLGKNVKNKLTNRAQIRARTRRHAGEVGQLDRYAAVDQG